MSFFRFFIKEDIDSAGPFFEFAPGLDTFRGPEQAGALDISNIVLTLDDASAPNWLAWYDDFVINGHSADDSEKDVTLDLLDSSGQSVTTIPGSGVGIVTLRKLPLAGERIKLRSRMI